MPGADPAVRPALPLIPDMSIPSVSQWPLWALFAATVAGILLCLTAGFRAGLVVRKRRAGEPDGPIGGVVGATLGLLAFMLAFTFGMTADRFGERKELLLEEVNALGTAMWRADLLPEPHRAECRRLLRDYVALRARPVIDPSKLALGLAETERLQVQLWAHAVALARADMDSDVGALFVEALNRIGELHNSRVTVAMQYRIPPLIWQVLVALTLLGMTAVGYQFGVVGRGSLPVHLILACSLALVVLLIADLDRGTGLLKVSQQPMLDLQARFAHGPP